MKINIYYGGRGLIDDPTLFVINKMQSVLEELHVEVERFNLYEQKNSITTLPQSLKSTDGIILATTVEWHGIGGYMTQFLDACWLYGDKEKISKIYMCPIVMSTTYGEREGKLDLSVAWEILGGLPCSGICGYIADSSVFERSENYNNIIEKKAENMYRTINQKLESLPASNQAVKKMVSLTKNIDLTPQESEQLSMYASDDAYVTQQKEDLQDLTALYKFMMGADDNSNEVKEEYIKEFKDHFTPVPGINAVYKMIIDGKKKPLIIEVNGPSAEYRYGNVEECDVEITIPKDTMDDIVYARMTFQRAFMGGLIKIKGDFKILRALDQLFTFMEGDQYV
ncbi:MAG: SCP2 sterol-binding domain-containing protein [Lachnospiraceae bacterium]|nr:SCP2 sterol-binding domain-containing protein [Lachnospiraceae bacterium]